LKRRTERVKLWKTCKINSKIILAFPYRQVCWLVCDAQTLETITKSLKTSLGNTEKSSPRAEAYGKE
jgi:hypothetical protein